MNRKCLLAIVLLLSAALLSSCALLPEEESIRTATVVRSFTRPEYETAVVERGDLIERAKISCRYVPVQSAGLGFALGGEYIDKIMVQLGDSVEEGQLLGQLQLNGLEDRIESAQNTIAELELRISHQQKLYELALRRHEVTSAKLDPKAKQEAFESIEKEQTALIQSLMDQLTLQQLTLEALEQQLRDRQIRAPFAGTITHISRIKDGDMSSFGTNVITLVDSTMSIFRATTEHWERFQVGDTYDIIVSKQAYPAVVADEAALGLDVQEKEPGKKANVYFALTQPAFELEEGDSGTVEIVLSEHMGVLHVPKDAVSAAGDQPIVYYQREDGMKAYKIVETGVTIGDRTEILTGLAEGETIIVD